MSDRLAVDRSGQYDTGQGPCLAAIDGRNVIRVDILDSDRGFSHFTAGALAMDVSTADEAFDVL